MSDDSNTVVPRVAESSKAATLAALQFLNECRMSGCIGGWREMYEEWQHEGSTIQQQIYGHLASDENPAHWFKLQFGHNLADIDWDALALSFKTLAETE